MNTNQDIHALLRSRASSRVFDPDRPVPAESIRLLLEAARWSPSSGNGQPWRYLIFDDRVKEERERARRILSPGNQTWAARAPLLILGVAREIRSEGKVNHYGQHDLGLANQSLLLQATALGLHCRPMGGFDKEEAARLFDIPEGHRPMVMVAIGYPGKRGDLDETVQQKEAQPRTRKAIKDFAFHGSWGSGFADESE